MPRHQKGGSQSVLHIYYSQHLAITSWNYWRRRTNWWDILHRYLIRHFTQALCSKTFYTGTCLWEILHRYFSMRNFTHVFYRTFYTGICLWDILQMRYFTFVLFSETFYTGIGYVLHRYINLYDYRYIIVYVLLKVSHCLCVRHVLHCVHCTGIALSMSSFISHLGHMLLLNYNIIMSVDSILCSKLCIWLFCVFAYRTLTHWNEWLA